MQFRKKPVEGDGVSETQGDHYFAATERMRERAERAEAKLAEVRGFAQRSLNPAPESLYGQGVDYVAREVLRIVDGEDA